jgi:hypothetical protein
METAQKQSGQVQKKATNKPTNEQNKFHKYNDQKIKEDD